MEIHELNTFSGILGSGNYFATDNGDDTSKISASELFAPLNARIDNIITSPAPSEEEIIDARLGDDGVTYNSLGAAIRTQFSDVKSNLENARDYALPFAYSDLFKRSDNLFAYDFCNHITKAYYAATEATASGVITITTTDNWQGWLIRVKPNTTYTLGPVDHHIIFFTSDLHFDKFINKNTLSATNPNTVTSASKSYWMAVTERITRDMSEWMCVEGSTYPSDYVDGNPTLNGEIRPSVPTPRLFGYMYANKGLPSVSLNNGVATLRIPANRVMYAGGIVEPDVDEVTELTINGANWVAFDLTDKTYKVGQYIEGHSLIMLGVINANNFENCWIAGTKVMINKTIAFMGDSLTAGSGTSTCYHQYLGSHYGYNFTCLNYGYGGSGYVRNYPSTGGLVGTGNEGRGVEITYETMFTPNNVLARLAEVDPSAVDAVVIFAGTNDWTHGDEISVSNFTDGVDAVFDYYQTHFDKVPLLVMTPVHRKNDTVPNPTTGKILSEYADIIIAECRKYGIPYIDTLAESGLHPDNAGNDTAFFTRDDTNVSDGLHPNHFAHERIMRCIADKLEYLIRWYLSALNH